MTPGNPGRKSHGHSCAALIQFDAIGFVQHFLPHLLISLTGMVLCGWVRELTFTA